jgi:hypothetical protein
MNKKRSKTTFSSVGYCKCCHVSDLSLSPIWKEIGLGYLGRVTRRVSNECIEFCITLVCEAENLRDSKFELITESVVAGFDDPPVSGAEKRNHEYLHRDISLA